ncbi:replication protein A 70 kDa DNA-binding subunit B-like isoform X3 [Phragmites australis]|uniref:replication protein A 70 kDa DNA-binding subunit B-like isoform X3 n=1 Tax=Phragmites australis TaxID=29695 RepID=UPI002D7716F1|nr:replication protein A 70 kDa DNA-binding subunit B-like isoform X3 [Phragmites australis]XP_062220227.1 replication protein A 70 kDa DNA-binding subunit B-like isoform X3 [Phragmites australis]
MHFLLHKGIICFTCDAHLFFQVRMRPLKRKRVEAPRIPTLEDVHPYTTWSMCVRVYHKFHAERFAVGRKRLSMVLLDEKGKKMAAVIYDDEVDRFEPLLVEGRVYYVWRMSAEPVMRNQDYMFADSHFVCRFTSVTALNEIRNVNEQFIPLFPPFMPFDKVWQFTLDNDMYVDVIGMVMYVSSMGHKYSFYNRKIPLRNIVLMHSSYNIVKLVVWDKLVTGNLSTWEKIAEDRAIVVATMLNAKRDDRSLHTTDFSRVYFDPDIAVAHELRRRINNELSGPPSP